MDPIAAVRIGPYRYRVVYEPEVRADDGVKLWGQIRYQDQVIRLTGAMPPERLAETFLHEILHGLDDAHAIGLKERQVHRLAVGMLAVLIDNPDLLAAIAQLQREDA